MKMNCILLFMLPLVILAQKKVNTDQAEISFTFVSKDVEGTIGGVQSSSTIDLDDFTLSKLVGSVAVETLDTDNFMRDGHLMWKKFFHKKDHPRIMIKSTGIVQENTGTYLITANLIIKEITKPIEAKAEIHDDQLIMTSTIFISDWDIFVEKERENNQVDITIAFPIE